MTATKVRYIIRHKKKGESSDAIGKDMKISTRRVNQVWREYKETGKQPIIGMGLGRPKKVITPEESEIIKTAFNRFKFGAMMLETVIDCIYNIHIPHDEKNRIKVCAILDNASRKILAGGEFATIDTENSKKVID